MAPARVGGAEEGLREAPGGGQVVGGKGGGVGDGEEAVAEAADPGGFCVRF